MKAKIIIWILALILLVGSVNAALTDNLVQQYSYTGGSLSSNVNNYLPVANVATSTTAGFIGDGWNFTASGQYVTNTSDTLKYADITACIWAFKVGDGGWSSGAANNDLLSSNVWPNTLLFQAKDLNKNTLLLTNPSSGECVDTGWIMTNETWHYLCFSTTSGNSTIYIDGVQNATTSTSCYASTMELPSRISGNPVQAQMWFGGNVDELSLWSRILSAAEIKQLYNTGLGCAYPFIGCGLQPPTDLIITATDDFNGSSINAFNVSISWLNGTIQTANTTNGTISLINVTYKENTTINVTYQANNYYNSVLYNEAIAANDSNSISASIYQAVRTFNSTEHISNNALTSVFYTGSKSGTTFNLTAANHNITAETTGYYNKTSDIVVSALTNSTETIQGIYSSVLNITVYNILNASLISSYNINITSLNYTWTGENSSTTNGSYYFNSINGTYNITIETIGYSTQTFNFSVNSTAQSYNITLFTTNSFNFTFKDEETDLLITKNMTVELIGDYAAYNYTTTTGFLYVDLLTPQIYLVRYRANETYGERFYYFQLNNGSINHITLYAVSNFTASKITTTLYDETNRFIEGGYIKVLRYYVDTNSYRVVEIARTNFEGITTLNLVKNNEFYKFIIEYPFGTIQRETEPTYIYANNLNFQILLATDTAERYYKSMGVSTSLTFDDTTNNFRYLWSDDANTMSKGCLRVYRERVTGETLINETCLETSSGVVYQAIDNITGYQYRAEAYAYFSEPGYYLGSLKKNFSSNNPIGTIGLFIVILLTTVFIFIGYWNLAVAVILTPLPLMFASIASIVPIPAYVAIPLEIVAVIIAYIISRKS